VRYSNNTLKDLLQESKIIIPTGLFRLVHYFFSTCSCSSTFIPARPFTILTESSLFPEVSLLGKKVVGPRGRMLQNGSSLIKTPGRVHLSVIYTLPFKSVGSSRQFCVFHENSLLFIK